MLVLGGGGILGEAWMSGLLAGVESESGIDFRSCEHFVGTSAGSIVAARLVAGRKPWLPDFPARAADPARAPSASLATTLGSLAARAAATVATPFAPLALALASPGGAYGRALALARVADSGEGLEQLADRIERWGTRFDGRLRVVAVERASGRRVVFGAPGAPAATAAEAVKASCAVPWIFRPALIGGREYVDGGVWSPTSIDVAPAGRHSEVLCLFPTARLDRLRSPIGRLALAMRPQVELETLALRQRGARVRVIGPDRPSGEVMGDNFMDPARRERVLAAGYAQGRELVATA